MRRSLTVIILTLVAFSLSIAQSGTDIQTGQYLPSQFQKGSEVLNYQIMYPNNFDKTKEYPVVVFFHGMGERGTDNKSQLIHGSKLFQEAIDDYPAVVLFPQCPPEDYWANLYRPDEGGRSRNYDFFYDEAPNPTMQLVIELVYELLEKPFTDNTRLYVSGLSMGGMATFEFTFRLKDIVAASLPICGGGPEEKAADLIDVPFWIFHGVKDDVIHPRFSIEMCKAIQRAGGKARITLFPEANHNSWDPAFADPEFLSWMFSQKRKDN
jgi:predicted peptidase